MVVRRDCGAGPSGLPGDYLEADVEEEESQEAAVEEAAPAVAGQRPWC